jgi:dTDP-4-dehydrorhamnose reductase
VNEKLIMKILVFGKDGQLGKAFYKYFSNLDTHLLSEMKIQYVGRAECDLANEASLVALLNAFQPKLIINASAYTAVDKAETEPELAFAINAKAPECMARYAAKNNATFLHYSTDYVFDGEKYGFYLENDMRNPLGVYGKSKAAGEEAIASAFVQSDAGQYAIFRTSWVYGDGGNFIRTILRLAKDRAELGIIHDQHGVPTSADWLAKVSLQLALNQRLELRQFPSGIYHAVPSGETSWHGLACLAVQSALVAGIELKAKPAAIKPILAVEYPLPAPRPMNSRMETAKLRSALALSLGDSSDSYNDQAIHSLFPGWDGLVKEYVAELAAKGLI